jgi:hypothetical protein
MSAEKRNLLLLFIESCAVDDCGWVDARKLSDDEKQQLKDWHRQGYIRYCDDRIELSGGAFAKAHRLRFERAKRGLLVKDTI